MYNSITFDNFAQDELLNELAKVLISDDTEDDADVNYHQEIDIEAACGLPDRKQAPAPFQPTAEQLALVDSFEDPDADTGEPTPLANIYSDRFANDLAGAALSDADVARLVFSVMTHQNFTKTDVATAWAIKLAKEHWDKYQQLTPVTIFEEKSKNDKPEKTHPDQPDYIDCYRQLVSSYQPEHKQWYLDRTAIFAKRSGSQLAISDYIDAQKDPKKDPAENLNEFLAELQKLSQIGTEGDGDCFVDLVELLALSAGYEWLMQDITYRGSLNVIAGDAGAGKTVFLLQLLINYIHGVPVFGDKECTPGVVCWVDHDANGEHFRDNLRVAMGGRNPETVRKLFRYSSTSPEGGVSSVPKVLTTAFLDTVKAKHDPSIIVIDPLRGAFAATEGLPDGWEKDSGTMTLLLDPIRNWAHANGVAVFLIHHNNRQGTISGSAAIQACTDVLWDFDRKKEETIATVRITKRLPNPSVTVWEFLDRRYTMLTAPQQGAALTENIFATKRKLAEALWEKLPAKARDLDELGKRSVVRSVIDELQYCGAIERQSDRKPYQHGDRAKFDGYIVKLQASEAKL